MGIEDNVAERKCSDKKLEIKKQVPKTGLFTKIKNTGFFSFDFGTIIFS